MTEYTNDKNATAPWQDEEILAELYHDKGLCQEEIADELGCHQTTISTWMERYDIQIKDPRGKGDLSASDAPASFYTLKKRYGASYEFWMDGSTNVRVSVHRLLAVAEYGFDAVTDKDIHHKNEITWDNRPENIEPLSRSEHMSLHHRVPADD